ncbi:proteasome assembly chaperone 4 [Microcaecilia unicolor]|uniref:Proteasome assembly chaperone 4 n=1 Tax=Microcaecilia unicolor TaxID=1415580 RepID=A0A6P7YHB5_9AMPH|nr:proteasome assembly chaperone 4 [Microcaecilia unicolor]
MYTAWIGRDWEEPAAQTESEGCLQHVTCRDASVRMRRMEEYVAAVPLPAISLHNFSEKISEQQVHFHVMGMADCLLLWIGATPTLSNLAVAMCNRFDQIPVSTSLLGDMSDTTSSAFAQRLAKKTKKQVFVSYNLPHADGNFILLIENRIKKEMESFPEKF